ncbi:MAG TPA: hypothetical protein VGO31_12050 [Microbacteriaceae bacterium]|jgi:hypothetical protein|nr:hypothetical protein [Microbacteriaceae bacterium]
MTIDEIPDSSPRTTTTLAEQKPLVGIAGSAAARRLDMRVLVVASSEAAAMAPHIDVNVSGLVVAGADALSTVRGLRHVYPDLLLMAEPVAPKEYVATEDHPFMLDLSGIFPQTLDDVLAGQAHAGASVMVTPTGFIDAGNSDALKAAVEQANLVERDDIVVLLPLHFRWSADPDVKQLIAVAKRSKHPVAIALGDRGNPLANKGVPAGYQQLFTAVPWAMPWRTDLAGFDALANGAKAAVIGQLPSLRRFDLPGKTGFAQRPGEKVPHILLPEQLRYSRTSFMQESWFASVQPYTCECRICDGRAVDRFGGSPEHRLEGHLHNLVAISEMRREIGDLDEAERKQWWLGRLRRADHAHHTLASYTSTKVDLPADIKEWTRLA